MYWTCENWALARVPARSRGLGGSKNHQSSMFFQVSILDVFFEGAFSIFLRFWEPQGSPWCSKMAPKCHGKTSNSGPNSGKWSRGGPRVPLGVIWDAIWSDFRCILDECWWGKPWKSAALCWVESWTFFVVFCKYWLVVIERVQYMCCNRPTLFICIFGRLWNSLPLYSEGLHCGLLNEFSTYVATFLRNCSVFLLFGVEAVADISPEFCVCVATTP